MCTHAYNNCTYAYINCAYAYIFQGALINICNSIYKRHTCEIHVFPFNKYNFLCGFIFKLKNANIEYV